ncbi:hypothetical protein [Salmonella enterica]|uniref:hypothetical protein n=1 Tax=Salmonella enterica TaxID=28901 RepID=UPI003D31F9FD
MGTPVKFARTAPDFVFELDQLVDICISDEWGQVKARAQYASGENQYLIHYQAADKASVYFSSVDNMIAQGNPVPIPYGEIMCGSRVISQEITTRDESTPEKVINLGRMPFFGHRLQDKLEQDLIDHGLPITKPRVVIR